MDLFLHDLVAKIIHKHCLLSSKQMNLGGDNICQDTQKIHPSIAPLKEPLKSR